MTEAIEGFISNERFQGAANPKRYWYCLFGEMKKAYKNSANLNALLAEVILSE